MWDHRTASIDRYVMLKEYALENQNHMTEAEAALWERLRARRFYGLKFFRQHIIGDYIVDFVCRDSNLIIEVDGGYHSEPRQQESDEERTKVLERLGFRVVRFDNYSVLNFTDQVLQEIAEHLGL